MKYWTYLNGQVPGSYEPEALAALPGFGMTTLVCPAQGEIAEKNWRRAGEFEDLVRALEARDAKRPPAEPLGAPPAPAASDVDALLDTASARLFSHVADLMKELETRRDEKGLVASLQRQVSALKDELAAAREKATMLELRVPRIAELEEARRKDQAELTRLQASLSAGQTQLNEVRAAFEKARAELETAKRRLQDNENDLSVRNRLVDKLSRELSEKELSLAKSLGVIRRLEEDLNRLCPQIEPPRPAAGIISVAAAEPAAPFTSDEPPPPPPYLEPPPAEVPKAQQALIGFLRKVFPGQPH